jgi:hypothetical protein
MIVEVKQEHIDEGTKGCPCYCAVSLAVYEALKDKYKFSDKPSLDADTISTEVEVGESWVETATSGAGAEISIYTRLEKEVVEDYIAIEDLLDTEGTNALVLEDWIENFDSFDDSEPTSFVIEDIHRMNN